MSPNPGLQDVVPKKPIQILFVGHSWADGICKRDTATAHVIDRVPELEQRISERLGQPVHLEVFSKWGSSTQWTIDQLRGKNPKKYDAVFVLTGMNDIYTPETVKTGLATAYKLASQSKQAFVFNLPPWDGKWGKTTHAKIPGNILHVNEFLRSPKSKIPPERIIDVSSFMNSKQDYGIHPKGNDWTDMRTFFVDAVSEKLGQQRTTPIPLQKMTR
jgi:hypothetical protein